MKHAARRGGTLALSDALTRRKGLSLRADNTGKGKTPGRGPGPYDHGPHRERVRGDNRRRHKTGVVLSIYRRLSGGSLAKNPGLLWGLCGLSVTALCTLSRAYIARLSAPFCAVMAGLSAAFCGPSVLRLLRLSAAGVLSAFLRLYEGGK